jgi:pilus assembly protein FimV
MKFKLNVTCLVLLALAAAPAWALQLGQIQVKSALNQPLVAVIPLHPKDPTELDGLAVGLAPARDFARAGLQLTPTDQTLRFHVMTDNNGQKLIVVTSSEAITDPYLDFLVQVNNRQGSQVREFVVLLNPVIASPAPEVQSAPVASAPASGSSSAQLPAPSEFPQPKAPPPAPAPTSTPPTPAPQSAPPQPQPVTAHPGSIAVERGNTLFSIAKAQAAAAHVNIYQMMLALQAENPDAFFKNNVDALKAGAILRIPTRDQIEKVSVAAADAQVHQQYAEWRAVKPKPATVVAGAAAEAAAQTQPKPLHGAPSSDHLALVPPSGEGGAGSNRPGVAGGTGSETVGGLKQQLQDARSTLISLDQANADLQSRMKSLQDIADKSTKLLSLKDATVAQLQRKLAQARAHKVSSKAIASALVKKGIVPANTKPWYARPVTWFAVAVVVVLVLFRLWAGKYLRRKDTDKDKNKNKGRGRSGRGPLVGPADASQPVPSSGPPNPGEPGYEDWMLAQLAEHPDNIEANLAACRWFYAEGDTRRFLEAATAMRAKVDDPGCVEWREVVVMGEELAPYNALFQTRGQARSQPQAQAAADDDPYGLAALRQPARSPQAAAPVVPSEPPVAAPAPETTRMQSEPEISAEPAYSDDPVDTKLDLARAYLDMGDPVGARAMLEEVLAEGTQTQKDEAKRLLAETEG